VVLHRPPRFHSLEFVVANFIGLKLDPEHDNGDDEHQNWTDSYLGHKGDFAEFPAERDSAAQQKDHCRPEKSGGQIVVGFVGGPVLFEQEDQRLQHQVDLDCPLDHAVQHVDDPHKLGETSVAHFPRQLSPILLLVYVINYVQLIAWKPG